MFDTIVMANLVRPTELCWLKLGFSPLFAGKRIVSLLSQFIVVPYICTFNRVTFSSRLILAPGLYGFEREDQLKFTR